MIIIKRLIVVLAIFALHACATGRVPLNVLAINSLENPQPNSGSFKGLEKLANPIAGEEKRRINIIYLHGIGYTEDRSATDQLAVEFLDGIAGAYNLDASSGLVTTLCGEAPITEADKAKTHIYLRADQPRIYETVIPGSQLTLNDLVCMDKQVLQIAGSLEFVVYRVFWDNIFWDSLQFAHVGQDDVRGDSEDIALQRRKFNRLLKDDLVNYGFSDAVMYLGPAGAEIRQAVYGAMCSAALDASGISFAAQGDKDKRLAVGSACNQAANAALNKNQFAFVTESLGSKIIFDVMRGAMTDGRNTIHDEMIRNSETYMLANQIALLSLSNLSADPAKLADSYLPAQRPRIIAMSEVNDFLSYELIPFYKQLYKRSLRKDVLYNSAFNEKRRKDVINTIGFDVVDMRLEFADKIIPFVNSFVNPRNAHNGHSGEPELVKYMLCGVDNGQRRDDSCLAQGEIGNVPSFLSNILAPKKK